MDSSGSSVNMADDSCGWESEFHSSGDDSQSMPNKKRKQMEATFSIWDHFTKLPPSGEQKATCRFCKSVFVLGIDPVRNDTTLNNHLRSCKKFPPDVEVGARQKELVLQAKEDGSSLAKLDQQKCREDLVAMLIEDGLPFSIVEGRGFKRFIGNLQPKFQIPSRFTVRQDCFEFYESERVKLKALLERWTKGVCLTVDTWTSNQQQISYMCLTCHFVDDEWKLQKKVINFWPIFPRKGESLGKSILKCMFQWGLDRVFTLTVDNDSSNDAAVAYLNRRFSMRGTSVADGNFMHVKCVAHILNLVAQEGLKDVGDSVNRVRAAVKFIRSSTSRFREFKDCVEKEWLDYQKTLCLDVSTRWNSTYIMLKTALYYARAFERFEEDDAIYRREIPSIDVEWAGFPRSEDWEKVKRIVTVLDYFFELTVKISGTRYVTSNAFFSDICTLYLHLKKLRASEDSNLCIMADKMIKKFDHYWGDIDIMNKVIFISVVLDPRYKLEFVKFALSEMYDEIGLESKVQAGLEVMFEEYKKSSVTGSKKASQQLITNRAQPQGASQQLVTKRAQPKDIVVESMISKFKKHMSSLEAASGKSELDKYLSEFVVDDKQGFDVLQWWRDNSWRYPVLSQMARDVLAVPISTVASEAALSTGGRVLDQFRSSLTPRMLQAIICAQDWTRPSGDPIKIEENIEELDKFEEEMVKLVKKRGGAGFSVG